MTSARRYSTRPAPRATVRGTVLLFTLISLVVMLVAAVALVRSFNNTLFTAGNIAFKRDMQNQAERIVPDIITLMQTGAMGTTAARATHTPARNYSATILASNPQGIPTALYASDTDFAAVGAVSNDVAVTLEQREPGHRDPLPDRPPVPHHRRRGLAGHRQLHRGP